MPQKQIPKMTRRMTMHLNGGSDFSELQYEWFADGNPTGIRQYVRTDGRPQYKVMVNVCTHGDEEYDLLKGDSHGLAEWVLKQLATAKEKA